MGTPGRAELKVKVYCGFKLLPVRTLMTFSFPALKKGLVIHVGLALVKLLFDVTATGRLLTKLMIYLPMVPPFI